MRFRAGEVAGEPVSRWSGRVRSPADECEPGRRVALLRKKPGKDQVQGRTVTRNNGRWSLVTEQRPGRFYAKVFRSRVTIGGRRVTCLPDRSPIQRLVRR